MSEKLVDLRRMSIDELIKKHDELAKNTAVGILHYLEEISRRDTEQANKMMLKFNNQIRVMTIIITILTFVNIILVALTIV